MTEINAYTDDEFPNDWGDEDIEFLAEFLRREVGLKHVQLMGDDDWDYALYGERGRERMSAQPEIPAPGYEDAQNVYVGVCWDCGVSYVRVRESEVQSTIQAHGDAEEHAVSIFPVDKSNGPGYAVHCHDCGFTHRFDNRNSANPERSARSSKSGHVGGGCPDVEIRELYYG